MLPVLTSRPARWRVFPIQRGSLTVVATRWSVLAAQTCECKVGSAFTAIQPLTLYRFAEARWEEVPEPGAGNPQWPSWSHDGPSIWYWSSARGAVMRYLVRERRHEEMLSLKLDETTENG